MVPALAIAVGTVLIGSVALALFLRSYGRSRARIEARVLDPRTPTVAYAIPNGVDPVVFQVGLTHAGFTSVVGRVGNSECVIVECGPAGRKAVRGVLQAAHANAYDGSELKLDDVVFEDER